MKISKREIQSIVRAIREEADIILNYDRADELDPLEDAWSGGENLTLPLDHSKATKGPAVHAEPEMLPPAGPVLNNESSRRIRVYRSKEDLGRSCLLPAIIYERYYDAYVSGNTEKALGLSLIHI